MKTPQEQAEELTNKAAQEYYEDRCELVNDAIRQEIPLPELIAVAQAANQLVSANTHADQFNCEELLAEAIIALRATGKVEL